jgi:hypothetical protein
VNGAQDLGEVFTPEEIVSEMLNNVDEALTATGSKVLEPACGNGNFLVSILVRKLNELKSRELTLGDSEFGLMEALTSIYAVDISEENVIEARTRLESLSISFLEEIGSQNFRNLVPPIRSILLSNVVQGDSLLEADKVLFVDYQPIGNRSFSREYFYLEEPEIDLFYVAPEPLEPLSIPDLGTVE